MWARPTDVGVVANRLSASRCAVPTSNRCCLAWCHSQEEEEEDTRSQLARFVSVGSWLVRGRIQTFALLHLIPLRPTDRLASDARVKKARFFRERAPLNDFGVFVKKGPYFIWKFFCTNQ